MADTAGQALSNLNEYAANIDTWTKKGAATLQKELTETYDEKINFSSEINFGATMGTSKLGFCTPDTNTLQVNACRRRSGVFDPETGVGLSIQTDFFVCDLPTSQFSRICNNVY